MGPSSSNGSSRVAGDDVARASVVVPGTPTGAFAAFTDEIGVWWRADAPYWVDRERRVAMRFEGGGGGRLVEVHDAATLEGIDVGQVAEWSPGRRLRLVWLRLPVPLELRTDLSVSFEAAEAGTRVTIEHRGFARAGLLGGTLREMFRAGWADLLGSFGTYVSSRPRPRAGSGGKEA